MRNYQLSVTQRPFLYVWDSFNWVCKLLFLILHKRYRYTHTHTFFPCLQIDFNSLDLTSKLQINNNNNSITLKFIVLLGRLISAQKLIPLVFMIMSQVINSQQTGIRHGQTSRSKGKNPSSHSFLLISMWAGILGVQTIHPLRRLIPSRELKGQTWCYGLVRSLL